MIFEAITVLLLCYVTTTTSYKSTNISQKFGFCESQNWKMSLFFYFSFFLWNSLLNIELVSERYFCLITNMVFLSFSFSLPTTFSRPVFHLGVTPLSCLKTQKRKNIFFLFFKSMIHTQVVSFTEHPKTYSSIIFGVISFMGNATVYLILRCFSK